MIRTLLVEGPDDEHVAKALFGTNNLPHINIIALGGKPQILEHLPVRLKAANDDILGVIVDADTQLTGTAASIQNSIRRHGYDKSVAIPVLTGAILDAPQDTHQPRLGIWIMPDNQTSGQLESFLEHLIPAESPLLAHVKHSDTTIPEEEVRFRSQDKIKAIIHTWLAWQVEPGRPLGMSITARTLDPSSPYAAPFVTWLKTLFWPSQPTTGSTTATKTSSDQSKKSQP